MATSVVLVKRFSYRGDASEEWSNRYFLSGTDPADNAAWLTLVNALIAQEKTLYTNRCTIVRAYGYTSDSPTAAAVYVRDLVAQGATVAGTLATTGGLQTPGDVAGWIRWKTSRVTSKGKPIYLRKYYHDVLQRTDFPDQISAAQAAAYAPFATLLGTGAGVDGRNIRGPGQSTEIILASTYGTYLTTRTLKRRGKRPTPAP